jgi:signal transduction histidine kinase
MDQRMRTLDPLAIGGSGRRVSTHQLNELLLSVLEPFEEEFNRLGVALSFRGKIDAEVKTNREVAQQVLANLVDNAMWFASIGGATSPTVTVTVTPTGFTVSDNGPGVPKAHRDSIFEPHFTTRDGAHGLGLTLVRDLLKTVRGRVRLTKLLPATFEVELVR